MPRIFLIVKKDCKGFTYYKRKYKERVEMLEKFIAKSARVRLIFYIIHCLPFFQKLVKFQPFYIYPTEKLAKERERKKV